MSYQCLTFKQQVSIMEKHLLYLFLTPISITFQMFKSSAQKVKNNLSRWKNFLWLSLSCSIFCNGSLENCHQTLTYLLFSVDSFMNIQEEEILQNFSSTFLFSWWSNSVIISTFFKSIWFWFLWNFSRFCTFVMNRVLSAQFLFDSVSLYISQISHALTTIQKN